MLFEERLDHGTVFLVDELAAAMAGSRNRLEDHLHAGFAQGVYQELALAEGYRGILGAMHDQKWWIFRGDVSDRVGARSSFHIVLNRPSNQPGFWTVRIVEGVPKLNKISGAEPVDYGLDSGRCCLLGIRGFEDVRAAGGSHESGQVATG